MLPNAALIITNSEDESVVIRVMNFPVLPTGSPVYVYLTADLYFESLSIDGYIAHNGQGTLVLLRGARVKEASDADESSSIDQMWAAVAAKCVRDSSQYADFLYPHSIDFGGLYPSRPVEI
jgi:hypothetical protein